MAWPRLLSRVDWPRLRRLPGLTPVGPWFSRIIRETAASQRQLLVANMACNVLLASSEAFTFTVIFQAARLLSADSASLHWRWSGLVSPLGRWLESIPRGQLFLLLLFFAVFLQALASLARYGNGLSSGWFAARCQGRILPVLHQHLLSLSYSCASRFRLGHLANVVSRAPTTVQIQILERELLLSNGLLVLVYLVALLRLNPWLSLVAISMALAIAALQRHLRPRIRVASRAQVEVNRQMAARLAEDLQLLRLLHSSAALRSSEQRIASGAQQLEAQMVRLTWLTQLLEPVADLMPVLAAALIGGLSWLLYRGNGHLLVPNLITFVLILQRLNIRLSRMAGSLNRLAENSAAVQELEDILDPAEKQFRRTGGLSCCGFSEAIVMDAVSLRYPGRSSLALSKVSLCLPRASRTALVGESGSGKSSLVDLLVGLCSPCHGQIRVDGIDLERLDLDQWQRLLGVVSQDVQLLNGSIADNIAFGLPDVSAEEIAEAARLADAEVFIFSLPEGYDTVVGERGFRLSGGQRQRLSLARALLRRPQLLILDEATSALDSVSEARILETIRQVSSDITVLSVAHRLSSICDADQIVVLDAGQVVERGSHAELMQLDGLYATLWRRQASHRPNPHPSP